jgi:cytochrome bd-type quinol oxidase subunit 2
MRAPVSTAIAIAVAVILLLGSFLPIPMLQDVLQPYLLGCAVIVGGVATLIGIYNLLSVHMNKLRTPKEGNLYSLFLILAFIVTLGAGLWFGPADTRFQRVVTHIQVPVETSLLAVLAISLTYTSLRLLKQRHDIMAWVFVISTFVFLIATGGYLTLLMGDVPALHGLINFINNLPLAGARGILLGVGLGSLTTGLRIVFGADRPYSG